MPVYLDIETYINSCLDTQWFTLWGHGKIISGVFPTFDQNSSCDYQTYAYRSVPLIGDESELKKSLQKGDYRLTLCGRTQNDRGIIQVSVNGNNIGTLDWYASTGVWNVKKTIDFTLTKGGLHTFRFKCTGKNSSSTNYLITLAWLKVEKTN